MSSNPPHTPYDGSSSPFSIGLRPLGLGGWTEPGDDLSARLDEKERLLAEFPQDIFVEEPDTRESQAEIRAMLETELLAFHPGVYRQTPQGVSALGRTAPDNAAPLLAAARLVQEDLILMRRGGSGWRLAAGALFFPSSWMLAEKFGRPMHEIHAPVPGFGAGTRMAEMIARIFDNLKPGLPAERFNWSVQSGDTLHLPRPQTARSVRAADDLSRFPDGDAKAHAVIRIERQTLHKMPLSGDILFTIRIHFDPLAAIAARPERASLAASLARQLAAMTDAQITYKGLAADRARLLDSLAGMAVSPA